MAVLKAPDGSTVNVRAANRIKALVARGYTEVEAEKPAEKPARKTPRKINPTD